MKKNYYTLISLAVSGVLYSTPGMADLNTQCLYGVPHFKGELVKGNPNELPVYIEADRVELNQPTNAIYEGNVDIKQGNRHLITERAEIIQNGERENAQRYALVQGGFDYKDEMINLTGEAAKIHLNSKDTDISDAKYELVDRQGRGTAQSGEMRENYRLLKNATFTSCLQGNEAWSIEAGEMRQYIKEEYAEMWHARFKVQGVPVFYMPYFQLPIGDRRRSGLLIPNAGSSSRDGYWYAQPVYWNIAPNYDATFTPKYMSRRGWQTNGEFRYLTNIGEGKIAGEYLHKDRYHKFTEENKSRHLFYWTHNSSFRKNWRLNVDYTRVSDKRYFNDFESDYGSSTDGYADQTARLAYYRPNYNFSLSAKQFQVFDEVTIGPYRALPQIDLNYYKNGLAKGRLDFKLFGQAVHFDNDSRLMPTAWRFHLEPGLNMPFSTRYGSVNIETKLYATRYNQKQGKAQDAEAVERSINRILPQIRLDFQTLLATTKTLIQGYAQTIEPRVQYLYRPYRNQSNIGSQRNTDYLGFGYDSALLQQDYFSLFRDRRYSGLDRIASANQFTIGGTTRIYDKGLDERFNVSVGQILYLNDSRIDDNKNNSTSGTASSWALESDWKINSRWNWRGSYQYDTRLNQTSLANSTLEYNHNRESLIQLTYRFASKEYIDQNLTSAVNRYNQDIQQLGATLAWELNNNWAVVTRYNHDIALNKAIEQYAGIQYNTCCWAVGIGARRYVVPESDKRQYSNSKDTLYDHSIGVTFELRGLGKDHYSGIADMLEKGMLPYIKNFGL